MKELISNLEKLFKPNQRHSNFQNFITQINFPFYKGLAEFTQINFSFPLTLLVGQNGCGKSSVLQALETAPEQTALTLRWVTTHSDPIMLSKDGQRPCYWYEYFNKEAGKIVQVLNTRINKKNNPDYWESSRPVLKYGMQPLEELSDGKTQPGRSKTRWNGVSRKVVYIDFRGELSAFDKYFYFEKAPRKKLYSSRQDYLRYFSKFLKIVFENNRNSYLYRSKQKVRSFYEFSAQELDALSSILGKNYLSAKIVEHDLYKNFGFSVFFRTDDRGYSEAFAGSGEMSVVTTVHKVFNAEPGSLILLDEPEVSLHPGAQKKLLEFLLQQILEKRHQIVISTHSPSIVENLPKEAITVLTQNLAGKFNAIDCVPAELAFQHIGHQKQGKKRIFVEDLAAKQLLEKVLSSRNDQSDQMIEVEFHPGGAKDLFKEALVIARLGIEGIFIFFDGDQKRRTIPKDTDISDGQLDGLITEVTGIKIGSFSFTADSGNSDHIPQEKRKLLNFIRERCFFMPGNDPEDTIWESSGLAVKLTQYTHSCYKERICAWAKDEVDSVDARDFKSYRGRLLKKMYTFHPKVLEINDSINKIVNGSYTD